MSSFFSYLAMNEVYSAVRDEKRSILLFKNGTPLSRWNEEKNSIDLPSDSMETVYRDIEKNSVSCLGITQSFPFLMNQKKLAIIFLKSLDRLYSRSNE